MRCRSRKDSQAETRPRPPAKDRALSENEKGNKNALSKGVPCITCTAKRVEPAPRLPKHPGSHSPSLQEVAALYVYLESPEAPAMGSQQVIEDTPFLTGTDQETQNIRYL
ncbi:hypothetical protein NDU88_003838 [Pleurodeles waltl]|uniref:Uncharacterized protein n=1 Tax=Pleurodeles waltl TaxID=8319 RepID=A0AAV7M4M6_PLEWA|nr:hypothetical protein NDU88_003838 [Pleurodeles waltl]